jgi:hypothetical protein
VWKAFLQFHLCGGNIVKNLMLCLTLLLASGSILPASAQAPPSILANQTFAFGANQLLTFTYTQNFDCIDQPNDDLDYNGIKAASDPNEMQIPICVAGINPSINPPGTVGNPTKTTAPLLVLVPMFSVDNDQNPNDAIACSATIVTGTQCGATLGTTLLSLFGFIPEAFKQTPLVYTQCPDPGTPAGTCTMHASRLDLGPALAALGLIPPPTANVFLPTPNHDHVLKSQDINLPAIWWQVIPVLVFNQPDWPAKDGSSGLTSAEAVEAAVAAGRAAQVPSNFFLFFSSKSDGMQMH